MAFVYVNPIVLQFRRIIFVSSRDSISIYKSGGNDESHSTKKDAAESGCSLSVVLYPGIIIILSMQLIVKGGSAGDEGSGIVADVSGSSYVTGKFEGSATFGANEVNETTLNSAGSGDIFVTKYDAAGFLLWAKKAGGVSGDFSAGIGLDASDNSYVTGGFEASMIFGRGETNETILSSAGSSDIFVAKYGVGTPTSVDETSILIDHFKLAQNYPNPFNPVTTIFYESPKASQITLAIYNLRGQLVRTLVSGEALPGRQQVVWDGTDNKGRHMASGIYIYKLNAGELRATKKMILLQ